MRDDDCDYVALRPEFTLRVPLLRGEPTIVIRAYDANSGGTHNRIDVEVRQGRKVIFPRGATHCGIPSGLPIDGIYAKELVMTLVAMKPGDTDSEYFADYTSEQLAWAEKYGELLECERLDRYCDEDGNVKAS